MGQKEEEFSMKMRVKIEGYVSIKVPKSLAKQYLDGDIGFDDVEEALQDDISEIDCGELENIESECEEIVD